jgi:hypothetical protein
MFPINNQPAADGRLVQCKVCNPLVGVPSSE